MAEESTYDLSDDDRRKFARIVSRAWLDDDFADRYASEPFAVLAEHGIDYPAVDAAPVLPPKPDGDLSLEVMESLAAAGGTLGTASSVSTVGGCAFTASTAGTFGVQQPPILE